MRSSEAFTFGPFRLEADANRLLRDGAVVLTGKAVDTLAALVRHRDRVVEKDELVKAVWPDAFVSDDSLTQAISMVRKALGDDSSQPRFVATVPRRGYRFIGELDPATQGEGHFADSKEDGGEPAPSAARLPTAATTAARWGWQTAAWVAAAVAVLLLVARFADVPRAAPARQAIRFEQAAPPGSMLASGGSLSPDGRHLAFVARDDADGKLRLLVRTLESGRVSALPGTEGAFRPFWSPDGQWIGFFSDGRLKRVATSGGPAQTLATVGYRPSGGTWSSRDVILYSDRMSPIYAVSASGGDAARAVTALDPGRQETAHYEPQFLQDGRHFLFFADSTTPSHRGTYVGSLDSPITEKLLDGQSLAVTYAPPSHLVFVRDQVLMAQPFDAERRRLSGRATPLGGELSSRTLMLSSAAGLLAFGGDAMGQHLAWFDRSGRFLGAPEMFRNLHNPVLSPDQRQAVADNEGIWLVDLERGASTRVAQGTLPIWSADGTGVVFTSRRVQGATDLMLRPVMGQGDDERLLVRSSDMKLSGDWSERNHTFVYVVSRPDTRLDIWVMPRGGEARAFLVSSSNEMQPRLSPDGRWIAYTSDESGSWEVYVQAFPAGGAKRVISVGGGAEANWTKGGRELVYLRPDGTMTSVDVEAGDKEIKAGAPKALFRVTLNGDITRYRNHYAVTSDGQRFLVDAADESTREPISVLVNWDALVAN